MLFDSWPWGAGHSDKEKNGLSKYWVSFLQCLVSLFSFLPPLLPLQMWVGLQRGGWELPTVLRVESVKK